MSSTWTLVMNVVAVETMISKIKKSLRLLRYVTFLVSGFPFFKPPIGCHVMLYCAYSPGQVFTLLRNTLESRLLISFLSKTAEVINIVQGQRLYIKPLYCYKRIFLLSSVLK